eukprot:TRINITY_DN10782_c0_g1_i10.p2 TRINITY_DN10782_c0_g1~~TRINITY_DN10782_c0_g1_i10.p2  ORF type:complete len:104 (+),score=37.45 TRINITY_DN10782_c0_g1_i10:61-372(+)
MACRVVLLHAVLMLVSCLLQFSELAFRAFDVMKVIEPIDEDGFLKCEHSVTHAQGFVPSNFVAHLNMEVEEQATQLAAKETVEPVKEEKKKGGLFSGFRSKRS